jgi:hypothetical protein
MCYNLLVYAVGNVVVQHDEVCSQDKTDCELRIPYIPTSFVDLLKNPVVVPQAKTLVVPVGAIEYEIADLTTAGLQIYCTADTRYKHHENGIALFDH